jgi:hypothetical protein
MLSEKTDWRRMLGGADRASSNARSRESFYRDRFHPSKREMSIERKTTSFPAPFRRSGGQLHSFPLDYSSAPSNGAGGEVKQRIYKHFTPHGVKKFGPKPSGKAAKPLSRLSYTYVTIVYGVCATDSPKPTVIMHFSEPRVPPAARHML